MLRLPTINYWYASETPRTWAILGTLHMPRKSGERLTDADFCVVRFNRRWWEVGSTRWGYSCLGDDPD